MEDKSIDRLSTHTGVLGRITVNMSKRNAKKKVGKKDRGLARVAADERRMAVGTLRGARTMGDLRTITVDGEKGAEGVFVGILTANGGAAGNRLDITAASVISSFTGGLFAKCFSTTGTTALYSNARMVEISITVSPFVGTLAQRSATGAYALTPPLSGGLTTAPGTALDLLQLEESMMYCAPLRETTTYSVSAPPWCSRPGKTLTFRVGGTEIPWLVGSTVVANVNLPVCSLLYYGYNTVTETSYVYVTAKFQFKGFLGI